MMRRSLVAVLIFSLMALSCQRDNYNDYSNGNPEQPQPKEMFNPPSWIYGNWGTKSGTTSKTFFVFNEANILYQENGNPPLLSMKADPNIKTAKEEIISDTEYKLYVTKYDIGNSISTKHYYFVKVSDTKIYFKTIGVNYVKL